ncbi:MAG: hypothetical protein M3341_11850 [Actinomycetota bacterium]|nr:hypothetical protein [Actinomycetota bacterium]
MTVHEPDQTRQEPAPDFGSLLLRVAWLAILLGLGMEVLLLLLGGALGDVLGVGPIVADFVRNITWSVFVCVGLAVGTAVAKARVPLMGFLGLFSAPLAFEASRVFHKGTLEALAVSVPGGEAVSPVLIAVVKGIEYGCLGLGVGWVSQRPWGGAAAHVAVGLLVGLVFGSVEIALASTVAPLPPLPDLLVEGINDVLFPVGCALVLFSADALGKRAVNRA